LQQAVVDVILFLYGNKAAQEDTPLSLHTERDMLLARDNGDAADILVVDDTLADSQLLAAILTTQGYRVRTATDGRSALAEIDRAEPHLILLDINMPGMDGFELCWHLKQSSQYAGIPVIFVSVCDDTDSKVAAFKCGGIDYVTKPFRVAEIKARVHAHLQLKQARDRLGYQAGHDPLTGLPNRSLLVDRLRQTLIFAERYGGQVAVAYIDLDKFKTINDRFGHKAGDQLLVEVSQRLQSCMRESDTIARIGGDEFVIVLYNRDNESITPQAMQRILDCVSETITLDSVVLNPSCSIGFACYPQDGGDVDTLLRNADTAMYRAKEIGRNNFQFYTTELNSRMTERLVLGKGLCGALERDEFVLHYQPRIDLRSGEVVGLEALIRWQHPERGLLPPGHFISIAEEAGLIDRIGEWVVRAVCLQHRRWREAGLLAVPIGINIASAQFLQPGFAQSIAAALRDTGVPAAQLELDLKESLLMRDPDITIRVLNELKEIGVGLSIDDFGTGFSNLGALKRFAVDRIKLDPSFVCDVQHHPDDLAVTDAVIAMAHSLRLKVVAECAESGSQLALLAARGCDEMQGDYFSPALPVVLCTALLRENRRLSVEKLIRRQPGRALLLVGEDEDSRQMLSDAACLAGCRLLQAADAHAAFDLLAAREIGVVVCGRSMADMNGAEFLDRVRRMYPHMERLMLGERRDNDDLMACSFLQKPWDERKTAAVLDAAFAQHEREAGIAAYA
jgi:diguanylate cyclase (GGDEF)-like protein